MYLNILFNFAVHKVNLFFFAPIMSLNTNIYDFLLPQHQSIMLSLHTLIGHLEAVYAYRQAKKTEDDKLYISENKGNIIELNKLVFADKKQIRAFSSGIKTTLWCELNEISFLKKTEILQTSIQHNINIQLVGDNSSSKKPKIDKKKLIQANEIQTEIFEESKRHVLCLHINHAFDNIETLYILVFRPDMKHWGEAISHLIYEDEKGYRASNKTILQSLIYQHINGCLDAMLVNKQLFYKTKDVETIISTQKNKKIAQLQETIKLLIIKYIEEIIPDFFLNYILESDIEEELMIHLQKPYFEEIIRQLDMHMRYSNPLQTLENNSGDIPSEPISIPMSLYTAVVEHVSKQHEEEKTNHSHNHTNKNNVNLSREGEVIQFLDKLEQAALILVENGHKITAANLIEVHEDYGKIGKTCSNSALSQALSKREDVIKRLFKNNPQKSQWQTIRSHFKKTKDIDKVAMSELSPENTTINDQNNAFRVG